VRRTTLAAALAAAVAGVLSAPAPAQDRPPPASRTENAREAHRVRGIVAFKRAVWRVGADGYDRAITELEHARDPATGRADFRTLFLLALSHAAAGRAQEGDAARKAAAELKGDFLGFRLIEAIELFHKEEWHASGKKLDAIITQAKRLNADPVINAELLFLAYVYRALDLRGRGSDDAALEDLREAVAISERRNDEPSSAAQVLLARSHVELQEYDRAEELLKEVLRREPGNSMSYANLALIYYDQHDLERAQRWYRDAVRRDPRLTEAREKLARIALRLEQLPTARRQLEALETALEALWKARPDLRSPGDAANMHAGFGEFWKLTADARARAGDAEGAQRARTAAERHFRRAHQERPDCVKALSLLIELLNELGAPEAEIEALEKDLLERLESGKTYRDTFC
jgi:tetratricopeptide (TPR) repeat protein